MMVRVSDDRWINIDMVAGITTHGGIVYLLYGYGAGQWTDILDGEQSRELLNWLESHDHNYMPDHNDE